MSILSLPNASHIELLQMLLALVAVGLGFWRLWIAVENALAITSTSCTDLRRLIAGTQVIGELFRLFKYGCLLAIGIISVLLPPPDTSYMEDSLQAVLVRFGLITITLTMIADSLMQEYRRRLFYEQMRENTAGAPPTN